MKKLSALVIGSAVVLLLTACGSIKNDTSMDAAKTFMTAMVEGDMEVMEEINHSDALSFPAAHMIDIANERGIIGLDIDDMDFEQVDDRIVDVTFETSNGKKEYSLVFNKEKEGYYFVELD